MPKISSGPSDHLEVDQIEEMVGRLGSYGNIPEVPVANSLRSVFFVAPAAVGDGDGSSAGNALVASSTVITDNATGNLLDVFVFLAGTYDFNDTTTGLVFLAGVKAFGLGGDLTFISNSNGSATAIMTWDVKNCEVAGFYFNEATTTVEGVVCTGAQGFIHHNMFFLAMENAVHTGGAFCVVEYNTISGPTNDGIEVENSSNTLQKNQIRGAGDNGINLNGNLADNNYVDDNRINGDGGTTDYAVQILLGDENEVSGNHFGALGTWPINNTGSDNIFTDNHDGTSYTGTHDITTANDKTETTITGLDDLDLWTNGQVYISIDTQTLITAGEGGVCTVLLKEKIDNSTYRPVKIDVIDIAGGGVVHPTLDWGYEGVESGLRATVQCSDDVTVTRAVLWKFKMV